MFQYGRPSSRLCAYALNTDTCQGDSGGPLTLKQGDRYVLLGVTSYGFGCADSRYAGIYARVQGFLPWIAGIVPGTVACGTAPAPNAGTVVLDINVFFDKLRSKWFKWFSLCTL